MQLGVALSDDTWQFFQDILDDLKTKHQVEVFHRRLVNTPVFYERLNRYLFRRDFEAFMGRNDVVFFEWASDLLLYASTLPKRCPIITRLHSYELFEWAPRINWPAVDKVIVVSQAMGRAFSQQFPGQAHKLSVVYNGVALKRFVPPSRPDYSARIGMLCNVLPIKRVYEVVLSLYELKRMGLQVSLHIAGKTDGDHRYTAAIESLIKRLDLRNEVFLDGFVANTEGWLQEIEVFISNSFWEGQQVALIEAMASGCYCLSHAWDGADEILPLDNLYVTMSELQSKILGYFQLSEPERWQKRACMRTIACEKFDLQNTVTAIQTIIEETSKAGS